MFGGERGFSYFSRGAEGRGGGFLCSSQIIPDFQSFLSSFWTFTFFSFQIDFQQAFTALRLMPDLNKLQNRENSELRGVHPVTPFLQRSICAANIRL